MQSWAPVSLSLIAHMLRPIPEQDAGVTFCRLCAHGFGLVPSGLWKISLEPGPVHVRGM